MVGKSLMNKENIVLYLQELREKISQDSKVMNL